MTEMFGEAWSPMSVPDLAPDDDDDYKLGRILDQDFLARGQKLFYLVGHAQSCCDLYIHYQIQLS